MSKLQPSVFVEIVLQQRGSIITGLKYAASLGACYVYFRVLEDT